MNRLRILTAAAAVMAFGLSHAFAATGIMEGDTSAGKVLTDAKGMTLYTFDKDKDGVSACYDKCAVNWPPMIAPADAKAEGAYGLTKRKDGTMQWTHDGKPLYLWIKDTKPGDVSGDGVNEVWHVAKPK